jgi:hypothetical protein
MRLSSTSFVKVIGRRKNKYNKVCSYIFIYLLYFFSPLEIRNIRIQICNKLSNSLYLPENSEKAICILTENIRWVGSRHQT